ncbi:MAG: toxin-antitoxin system HicB family antitoxin [Dehalococcoidia bacterium]|nr:toxin-antitoxin system HicB family antitoxin [Dehalococcoidia bacterium]
MVIKGNMEKEVEYYTKLPYTVIVEQWDDGKGPYWVARIAELPHCLIHADTPEEAIKEIQEVKIDWIKSNLARRLPVPEPRPRKYSGQIRLRISPSLHKLLAYRAETEGLSLNQYMGTALATVVGVTNKPPRLRKARKNALTEV